MEACQLPEVIVLHILGLLSRDEQACTARRVNKSAYILFGDSIFVNACWADLPLWVLQLLYPVLSSDFERKRLLAARAAQGELQQTSCDVIRHSCTCANALLSNCSTYACGVLCTRNKRQGLPSTPALLVQVGDNRKPYSACQGGTRNSAARGMELN